VFWAKKSFSDEDVLEMAMLIREIDKKAEEVAHPVAGGTLEWVKIDPSNKRKVHKAMGIIHGVVAQKYQGEASDFDNYFKSVILKAFNYGPGMNFGKMMYKDHIRLRNKMDEDYFSGIKEGKEQILTGENLYLKHRLTW
jgi:hypothetical protein